ncbi:MAG TPA: YlzJ-like family protein [Syntrophomonadaceae bacterium]|nr:YlzJ-like family protein [Syntrophomonadaceae bacterium]
MLYYLPEDISLLDFENIGLVVNIKLASGGFIEAEPLDYNHVKVKSIISTDPMDYLNSRYQPGEILALDLMR